MLYFVYLVPTQGNLIEASFQTWAVDRADALAQAPDDWPVRRTRARRETFG